MMNLLKSFEDSIIGQDFTNADDPNSLAVNFFANFDQI